MPFSVYVFSLTLFTISDITSPAFPSMSMSALESYGVFADVNYNKSRAPLLWHMPA